jgi:hypothetical protein
MKQMKKILFLMLTLLFWSVAGMNAQVLIGSQLMDPDANPHDGAVLELQSDAGDRGLLLPQVALTSATDWLPVAGSPAEGITVFNSSTTNANGLVGKGIYVWISGSWNKMGASVNDVSIDDYTDAAAATLAGISWGLSGITCFDVRSSLVASSS